MLVESDFDSDEDNSDLKVTVLMKEDSSPNGGKSDIIVSKTLPEEQKDSDSNFDSTSQSEVEV